LGRGARGRRAQEDPRPQRLDERGAQHARAAVRGASGRPAQEGGRSLSAASFDVAVVVPVRDGAAFLRAALESALAQEPPPREIVVVDDGSTDDSVRIAEALAPRVRVLRQDAAGAGAARNRGVAATSSAWIAFL